jgi:hypothetical protein
VGTNLHICCRCLAWRSGVLHGGEGGAGGGPVTGKHPDPEASQQEGHPFHPSLLPAGVRQQQERAAYDFRTFFLYRQRGPLWRKVERRLQEMVGPVACFDFYSVASWASRGLAHPLVLGKLACFPLGGCWHALTQCLWASQRKGCLNAF